MRHQIAAVGAEVTGRYDRLRQDAKRAARISNHRFAEIRAGSAAGNTSFDECIPCETGPNPLEHRAKPRHVVVARIGRADRNWVSAK